MTFVYFQKTDGPRVSRGSDLSARNHLLYGLQAVGSEQEEGVIGDQEMNT